MIPLSCLQRLPTGWLLWEDVGLIITSIAQVGFSLGCRCVQTLLEKLGIRAVGSMGVMLCCCCRATIRGRAWLGCWRGHIRLWLTSRCGGGLHAVMVELEGLIILVSQPRSKLGYICGIYWRLTHWGPGACNMSQGFRCLQLEETRYF